MRKQFKFNLFLAIGLGSCLGGWLVLLTLFLVAGEYIWIFMGLCNIMIGIALIKQVVNKIFVVLDDAILWR